MNVRRVARISLKILFFGAWLAVGLVVLAMFFAEGGSDKMDCCAQSSGNTGMAPEYQAAAPSMAEPEAAPGAAAESESSAADSESIWADLGAGAVGESSDASGGLGLQGLGEGGAGASPSPGLGAGIGSIGAGAPSTAAAAPSASPPVDTGGDPLSDVDAKLASLPLGTIAFNTPETIPLGDSARIELLVSLKEAEEELRREIRAAGPVDSARVKISNQMEARLTGLGFRIEAITPERQAVTRGQHTQWQWQIEPNKSATLELHLTLSALIELDGIPATRAVRTFERTILVDVPFANRVADLLADHFQILLTVVLIPVAGGIYRHVRKKRKAGGADQVPPAKQAA